jgi:hypothetical protein
MKKRLLFLGCSILICLSNVNAQGFGTVDINNVNATVNTSGSQFWDLNQASLFEVPKGSGKSTIFASNLWIGGVDVSNQLKMAAARLDPDNDFYPGPILGYNTNTDYATEMPNWERVWVLTQAEIQNYVDFYECGIDPNCNQAQTYPNYIIPIDILEWPAHGDVLKDQAKYLAPFVDRDGDGEYEPLDGDIPAIKGHQAAYFILNDVGGLHLESGAEQIGIEVHCMAYAMSCSDAALNNTLFMDYRIINRHTFTITDTYLGVWTDGDLGNPLDDFVGSDVDRSAYYFYNGDSIDEDNAGALGYGADLAAQAVVILGGAAQDPDGMDNQIGGNGVPGSNESPNGMGYSDGITDNERLGLTNFMPYSIGGSSTGSDFYNSMRSIHGDGTHAVYGGTGHTNGCPGNGSSSQGFSCDNANFMFPDSSDSYGYGTSGNPQVAWSETYSGNIPADRRGVGASGPFTFAPNAEINLNVAYVFAQENNPTNHSEVDLLKQRIDSVRSYFINDQYPCYSPISLSVNSANKTIMHSLYPNPTKDQITLQLSDISGIQEINLFNSVGELLSTRKQIEKITHFDLSTIESGIYFLIIQSDNQSITEKIIKY